MILTPIAMRRPNRAGIYAPSQLRQPKEITYREFLATFADNPQQVPVSFDNDGVSNPQSLTAYSYGMDAWYIIIQE